MFLLSPNTWSHSQLNDSLTDHLVLVAGRHAAGAVGGDVPHLPFAGHFPLASGFHLQVRLQVLWLQIHLIIMRILTVVSE